MLRLNMKHEVGNQIKREKKIKHVNEIYSNITMSLSSKRQAKNV